MAVNQLGTSGCRTYQSSISMWITQKFGASASQAIPQLVLLYSSGKWEVQNWSNLRAWFATIRCSISNNI